MTPHLQVETGRKDHRKYVNNHYLSRDKVVPFYVDLILSEANEDEIKRVNSLILSKWRPSGLEYIKNKAWKAASQQQLQMKQSITTKD